MKKLLSTLLLTVITLSTWAYDVKIDGIYYYLNREDKIAIVVNGFNSNSYSGSVVIPSSITYSDTTYNVKSINTSSFYNSSGLTSVTIPNSVTEICNGAFRSCTGLTSITIPNSVTKIGYLSFADCIYEA